jgi:hypothetical protein
MHPVTLVKRRAKKYLRRTIRLQAAALPAMQEILCLGCAEVFPNFSTRVIRCPSCQWSVASSDYEDLFGEAGRVVRFGFMYRQMFEAGHVKKQKVTAMPFLAEAPQWLVFCAVAALSGIVGNASYAAVKNVIRRILNRRTKRDVWSHNLSADDRQIRSLIAYLREYLDRLEDVRPEVRSLVIEEERAHLVTAARAQLRQESAKPGGDSIDVTLAAYRIAREMLLTNDTACMDPSKLGEMFSTPWPTIADATRTPKGKGSDKKRPRRRTAVKRRRTKRS